MKTAHRLAKFSLVGILGAAVQLLTLAALTRAFPAHYLLATVAALELTILHNFAWHLHYTWRDRLSSHLFEPCLRFHITNGLVSLVGNLTLMTLLVHRARLAPVPANLIAIAACSLANFHLSNRWTFRAASRLSPEQKCMPKNGATS